MVRRTVASSSTRRMRREGPKTGVGRSSAAVALHDAVRHGQVEPGPVKPFGREERIENPRPNRGRACIEVVTAVWWRVTGLA